MKVSELINKLRSLKRKHGDKQVSTFDYPIELEHIKYLEFVDEIVILS